MDTKTLILVTNSVVPEIKAAEVVPEFMRKAAEGKRGTVVRGVEILCSIEDKKLCILFYDGNDIHVIDKDSPDEIVQSIVIQFRILGFKV